MAPTLCRDEVPCTWAPKPFRSLSGLTVSSKWNPKASTVQVSSPASASDTSTVGSDPLADVLQWLEHRTVRDADTVPQDTVTAKRDAAPGIEVDGEDDDYQIHSRVTSIVTDDDCEEDACFGDHVGDELRSRDAQAQPPRGSNGQDGKAIARPGRILQPNAPTANTRGECDGDKVTCSASSVKGLCLADGKGQSTDTSAEDEEEKEWEHRRRLTGTVGRLVRYYHGMNPREDVTLRGGKGRHVIVAEVRDGGQAGRCGIRAGDRLVSIDGSKEFQDLSADAISEKLEGPTVLVFVGFIGQLQAEVRLNVTEESLGISNRQDVLTGSFSAPLQLCEERVFNTGMAPLFLSVGFEEEARPFFELRRADAFRIVRNAVSQEDVDKLLANRASGFKFDGAAIGKSLVQAKPAMPNLQLHRWSHSSEAKSDRSDCTEAHEV